MTKTKKAKAARVKAECSKCGVSFERSVYHSYLTTCPECRAVTVEAGEAVVGTKTVECRKCHRKLTVNRYDYNNKVCDKCR
jgi:Zn finger protein HypA/HybF involved in hydrogenase expression